MARQDLPARPDRGHTHQARQRPARRRRGNSAELRIIAECDRKLTSNRVTLDAGGDPTIISEWITQTQAEKTLAESRLRQRSAAGKRLTHEQIRYIVTTLTDITQVIHDADPRDKTEIYSQPGLRLTYHPAKQRS